MFGFCTSNLINQTKLQIIHLSKKISNFKFYHFEHLIHEQIDDHDL